MKAINFEGGHNIALKIPFHLFEETLHFYRDILLLDVEDTSIEHPQIARSYKVYFGSNILWLDCMKKNMAPAVWLELTTEKMATTIEYLATNNISTCDDIEQIPQDMHWIKDPAGNVFILKSRAKE